MFDFVHKLWWSHNQYSLFCELCSLINIFVHVSDLIVKIKKHNNKP